MRTGATALLIAVASAALAGCGQTADATHATHATQATRAAAANTPAPQDGGQLFARIDRALAAETSVREDAGNQNPPPTTTLIQEYGTGRDAVSFTVDLGHGTKPIRFYRAAGKVYVEGRQPIPMAEIDRDDTAALSQVLHSDVRQDFRRLADGAAGIDLVGEESLDGTPTQHYRFDLRLARDSSPAMVPALVRGSKPAELWVDTDSGLPVRLEVTYREPVNGLAGTGVVRVDYSGWSEPLDLDVAHLDWS